MALSSMSWPVLSRVEVEAQPRANSIAAAMKIPKSRLREAMIVFPGRYVRSKKAPLARGPPNRYARAVLFREPGSGNLDEHVAVGLHAGDVLRVVGVLAFPGPGG